MNRWRPWSVAPAGPPQAVARALLTRVEVHTVVTDNAEAFRLRVEWMVLIGNVAQDIADSLRWNPPQSVAEEQGLLDPVHNQLEWETQFTGG